ncbi:hypothetical protein [Methylocystis sp. SC2]|uniref:hypothetical protein n=1 Tax=Methylocystis sp. (strain SC2) TaxID=187303 RepID=UPI00027AE9E1|nr:hypothetical protein [Methylocystis sp. SC2]CCJ06788.1 Hypothetical protein BN69_1337 [Methylocystis sp. SC2]
MSQLRAMRREFRAALAVAAVCALMLSLLLSGATRPAHAFANQGGVACDHAAYVAGLHATAAQKGSSTQRDGAPAHSPRNCPDCCLNAHAGHAVLPERLISVARPNAEPAAPIQLRAVAAQPPESFAANGANGARAPPSIHIF